MSGGSYNYAYGRVQDMADSLRDQYKNPLRHAFANHLRLVADAMRAVEWVDSGDNGPGDEDEAIRKLLSPSAELISAIVLAEQARSALAMAIDLARHKLAYGSTDTSTNTTEGSNAQ